MSIGGIILAGGRSTRMGRPKALLRRGGVTLVESAVALLGTCTDDVVAVSSAELPMPTALRVVTDLAPGRGPLEGLRAGMRALPNCDAVMVLAVDLPAMTGDVLKRLIEEFEVADCEAVVPRVAGRPQPLCAVYSHTVLARVEAQLQSDALAMTALLERLNVKWLDGLAAEVFRNVNTPADLELLGNS
jgi:molybdopterin-guanine dinucleotide biosynthesis protein A